jgi:peptidoglycan hydrolase-like protein with peptidoglycan-binding domain
LSYPGVLARASRLAGAAALALIVVPTAPAWAAGPGSGGASLSGGSSQSSGTSTQTKSPTKNATRHSSKASGSSRSSSTTATTSAGDSKHLGDRVLRQGMQGHDVRVLQDYLTIAGFPTPVVGNFGPTTQRNVIAFQRSVHMTPNGVVTVAVEKALRRAVAAIEAEPPVGTTRINADGTATAPSGAPAPVRAAIAAANRIIDKPYIYAGGHGTWEDSGYDCSGAVSYALHGAGLLSAPEDSTELESYGSPGTGRWMTIYADASHTFIVIAGRAFDTANYGGPNIPNGSGPRWRSNPTGNLADGGNYIVRHPQGL